MQPAEPFAVGFGKLVQSLAAVPVLFWPACPVDEDPDRGSPGLDFRYGSHARQQGPTKPATLRGLTARQTNARVFIYVGYCRYGGTTMAIDLESLAARGQAKPAAETEACRK
jgi:hypothetical protein